MPVSVRDPLAHPVGDVLSPAEFVEEAVKLAREPLAASRAVETTLDDRVDVWLELALELGDEAAEPVMISNLAA